MNGDILIEHDPVEPVHLRIVPGNAWEHKGYFLFSIFGPSTGDDDELDYGHHISREKLTEIRDRINHVLGGGA